MSKLNRQEDVKKKIYLKGTHKSFIDCFAKQTA